MNYEKQINELAGKFGVIESEEYIEKIKRIINNSEAVSSTKSKGLCLIGQIICYISPYLKEDMGYSYFKEALEFDKSNYDAILGICSIFDTYPYPFNTIVTEKEYIYYVQKLIEDFDRLEDNQKSNTLQTIKSYLLFRTRLIDKKE